MKKLLITLITALAIGGCSTMHYVPVETDTQVHIKDSTVYNYIDSIRIHEATRYKEMGWLTDTARIKSSRGNIAWAVADTAGERLTLGLEEAPFEEKTRIVYKDRIQYRDSIQYVEKPIEIPIETEVKVYPRWMIVLSLLGIASTLVLGFLVYLKIKKK